MKNRKLLYILIPATLLVWGMILQKIFSASSDEEGAVHSAPASPSPEEDLILADTFSICRAYQDPFRLRIKRMAVSRNSAAARKNNFLKKASPIPIAWPVVIYGGIIKNQKSGRELALVQVNGQSSLMNTGDKAGELQVLKIYKDSIQLRLGNETKFVSK